jgi:hypothetical protein
MALKPTHPGEHPNRVTSILNGQRAIIFICTSYGWQRRRAAE